MASGGPGTSKTARLQIFLEFGMHNKIIRETKVDSLVKNGLLRCNWLKALRRFIQFCHFERQREILNNQDSSSLSLLGMTTAKASKIILNIVELLRSPISVLRFRPSEFHVQLSTLHSTGFCEPPDLSRGLDFLRDCQILILKILRSRLNRE